MASRPQSEQVCPNLWKSPPGLTQAPWGWKLDLSSPLNTWHIIWYLLGRVKKYLLNKRMKIIIDSIEKFSVVSVETRDMDQAEKLK